MKKSFGFLTAVIAGTGISASAMGAAITFSAPVAIGTGTGSAAAVQFLPGTILSATDFGGGTQTTAVGVTFLDGSTNGAAGASIVHSLAVQSTNVAQFHATDDPVLNAALGGFANDQTPTIELNGLTIGTTYQVQLFAIDDRPEGQGGGDRSVHFSDGTNNSATFVEKTNVYVLGTFTANASTEDIQSVGTGRPADLTDTGSNFNAVIVRSVPEPASLGLLGIAGLGLLARRRQA